MRNKIFCILLLTFLSSQISFSQGLFVPDTIITYKKIDGIDLKLHVFYPKNKKANSHKTAIVSFFGGGWMGGNPKQFYQQSSYYASRGMLAFSAEYRVIRKHKISPIECVKDAKSAIRWVRENAKKLGVDPNKIIASGGSAGGHIAACTGIIEGYEEEGENLNMSSIPNAMVLFNPVMDTTKEGYGAEKLKGRVLVISPNHHIKNGIVPTLIFHGNADTTVPFQNAVTFNKLMNEAGNKCKLVVAKGENHGFFNGTFIRKKNDNKYYEESMYETDVFLRKMGFLKGKPLAKKKIIRVACIGDSNTQRKYPEFLQEVLGDGFVVTNNGKGAATVIDGTLFPFMKTKQHKEAMASNPNAVVIMLGTNDANPRWWDNARKTNFKGAVADEFREGYEKLIRSYKNLASEPEIYICKPIPVFVKKPAQLGRKANLENKVTPIVLELAKKYNLKVIDLYKTLKKREDLTLEGLHYKNEGYRLMASEIKKVLKKIK